VAYICDDGDSLAIAVAPSSPDAKRAAVNTCFPAQWRADPASLCKYVNRLMLKAAGSTPRYREKPILRKGMILRTILAFSRVMSFEGIGRYGLFSASSAGDEPDKCKY